MKKKLFFLFLTFIRPILSLAYDKKYLKGKEFDNNPKGWIWAIKGIFWQKIMGYNRHIPWPASPFMKISSKDNIVFHEDSISLFQVNGLYLQNFSANIVIGIVTYIAPNVGIITANHDPMNPSLHLPGKDVIIGNYCWIGMNSVILPGVILGDHTVVGAGSIVTKSFPEGNVIIAGNPAKIIRHLESDEQNPTSLSQDKIALQDLS